MALHNGIDTVAVVSHGIYSKTYGQAHPKRRVNLYASWGLLDRANQYSLHNGLDTIAIAMTGIFSKVYGADDPQALASLYASWGLYENATAVEEGLLYRGLMRLGLNLRV